MTAVPFALPRYGATRCWPASWTGRWWCLRPPSHPHLRTARGRFAALTFPVHIPTQRCPHVACRVTLATVRMPAGRPLAYAIVTSDDISIVHLATSSPIRANVLLGCRAGAAGAEELRAAVPEPAAGAAGAEPAAEPGRGGHQHAPPAAVQAHRAGRPHQVPCSRLVHSGLMPLKPCGDENSSRSVLHLPVTPCMSASALVAGAPPTPSIEHGIFMSHHGQAVDLVKLTAPQGRGVLRLG